MTKINYNYLGVLRYNFKILEYTDNDRPIKESRNMIDINSRNIKEDIKKLEVDGIFRNYKHLFVTLGWQKSDTQLSGHNRRVLLDILSQFARVEKMKENCDLLIVREIYKK